MALFGNPHTGRRIMLRSWHAFGRHPTACQTVLASPDVSQVHALVRWSAPRWEIFDQSRNGTFLNGKRLQAGVWVALELGHAVLLGDSIEAHWMVTDLAPPSSCLFPLRGTAPPLPLLPHGMFLPSEADPEIYLCSRDGSWVLEDQQGLAVLQDGAAVRTTHMLWETVLCPDLDATQAGQRPLADAPPADILLRFELSQNEEHARLSVQAGHEVVDLGERIHHYLLVTLARRRQADARRGWHATDQGWVSMDELARMLGAEPSHVNIQIFRARHQLANALPPQAPLPLLVERRRGEVRMGDYAFSIQRGSALEEDMRR